jgi:hypothetical protein
VFTRPEHFSALWSERAASPSDLKREMRRAGFDLDWKAWPHTSWEGFGDRQIKWIARAELFEEKDSPRIVPAEETNAGKVNSE